MPEMEALLMLVGSEGRLGPATKEDGHLKVGKSVMSPAFMPNQGEEIEVRIGGPAVYPIFLRMGGDTADVRARLHAMVDSLVDKVEFTAEA